MKCPSCGYRVFMPLFPRREMRMEIEIRSRFVRDRLDHKPKPAELMDLTEFMHGGPEGLLACRACGLVIRDESRDASYTTDFYDPDLLQHLYPRYLQAFREKRDNYQDLLGPHAELIEVGSHLGAFLQAAEESGWRPTGLDVGKFTSEFAAGCGLRVKREAIEYTGPRRFRGRNLRLELLRAIGGAVVGIARRSRLTQASRTARNPRTQFWFLRTCATCHGFGRSSDTRV